MSGKYFSHIHTTPVLPVEHRSCNRVGKWQPTPPPYPLLKIILKFFAKLLLPRKQSFNFIVVFLLKRKTFLQNVQRLFKIFFENVRDLENVHRSLKRSSFNVCRSTFNVCRSTFNVFRAAKRRQFCLSICLFGLHILCI